MCARVSEFLSDALMRDATLLAPLKLTSNSVSQDKRSFVNSIKLASSYVTPEPSKCNQRCYGSQTVACTVGVPVEVGEAAFELEPSIRLPLVAAACSLRAHRWQRPP